MNIKRDLGSKLLDGLLASLVLTLQGVMVALLIRPVEIIFGRPGLLIYTVIILAIAVVAIERCVAQKLGETTRSLWGASGGVLAWIVIELSNMLEGVEVSSSTSVIALMLTGSVTFVLWKNHLPQGARFYGLTMLTSWAVHIVLSGQLFLGDVYPHLASLYQFSGLCAAGLAVLILAWVLFFSRTRNQRMWAAVGLWVCFMVLIYVFRGGLI